MSWWTIGSLVGIWLGVHWGYVVCMAAKDAIDSGKLTLYWKVMLLPAAVLAALLDVVFNYTFGWMFLAVPQPVMFSSTMQWHFRNSTGWRLSLSKFFARNLNVFDYHIKP